MTFSPAVDARAARPGVRRLAAALFGVRRRAEQAGLRRAAALRGAFGALFLLLSLTAAAQDAAPVAEYQIGPKDLLEIKVLEIPELNVERRVNDNGVIELPLVGSFGVNGMTTVQAGERLERLLTQKYVNRANVSIVVKEFANKPLSIVGAVAKPGSLNLSGRYTLLQVISSAGGLTAQAGKRIYVMRSADNGLTDILEVKTDDLLRSSNGRWNIPIYPGDVVNIPARTIVKVFCMGEVKSPGALEFDADDRITLLSVIAKAGGLTTRASKNVLVKRRGADGRDIETHVNYNRVVSGSLPDPELSGDDVVIVKESFF